MPRLHRNNAAERGMVIALTPLAWAARLWRRWSGRRPGPPPVKAKPKPTGRPPVIEGLPPRSMN